MVGPLADNMTVNVEENIKKSRRSAYGLFGGGFHGNNGLDPETLIHLFNTYIMPVLMYGMELIIPKTTALEQLERYQKNFSNNYYHYHRIHPTQQFIYYPEHYHLRLNYIYEH